MHSTTGADLRRFAEQFRRYALARRRAAITEVNELSELLGLTRYVPAEERKKRRREE